TGVTGPALSGVSLIGGSIPAIKDLRDITPLLASETIAPKPAAEHIVFAETRVRPLTLGERLDAVASGVDAIDRRNAAISATSGLWAADKPLTFSAFAPAEVADSIDSLGH